MNTFEVFTGLIGGLGLFLYGMKLMGDGLENAAGDRLKGILEKITSNRVMGVFVGAIVTAVIQSSSATTVMVVSFVNAGLMSLIQAAGVIMGANVGTTITAQMVSFKLDTIAPIFIGVGAIVLLVAKKKKVRDMASIALGFGILFMGMGVMSGSMKPIAEAESFKDFVVIIGDNRILGILAGLAMTAIVQSSSATTGILVALATTGAIGMDVALPVIFGCNIGTCVTALLASLGGNKTAKKAALIHLFFNLTGTLIFLPFMDLLINIVQYTDTNVARQVANAHTIFNVTATVLLLPMANLLVKLANKCLPGDDVIEKDGAIYLSNNLLDNPMMATTGVIKETIRMADKARKNLELSMKAFEDNNEVLVKNIYENEKIINTLEKDITAYLVRLSENDLSESDGQIVGSTYHVINDIERIGDHAKNIAELALEKMNGNISLCDEATKEIKEIYDKTLEALNTAIKSYEYSDLDLVKRVNILEEDIDNLEKISKENNIDRLNKKSCKASSSVIFVDLISNLERIADHATNIAEAVK